MTMNCPSFERVIAAGHSMRTVDGIAVTSLDRLRRICDGYVEHQIADGLIAWWNLRARWRFQYRQLRFARRRGMHATRLFDTMVLETPTPQVVDVRPDFASGSLRIILCVNAEPEPFPGGAR